MAWLIFKSGGEVQKVVENGSWGEWEGKKVRRK
jgi:hypothetical protein